MSAERDPLPPMISGIYAILNATSSEYAPLLRLAQDYLKGGVRILQLRDKESPSRPQEFLRTAQEIKKLKKTFDFVFIVNDDVAVAQEVGAEGVHVGRDDLSLERCRELLGPDRLIGYSSHSLEEALDAERRGADYVAFGAIFPTANKAPGHPIQGIERLRQVVQAVNVPVVAIGGINRENFQDVLATGVASVAMISALANSGDRVMEAKYFKECMK